MMPKYNKDQIIFCLSLFSNYASATRGSQAELQQLLTNDLNTLLNNAAVISFLGSWKVIWGPVVFVPEGIQQQQANATFIAQYQGSQPGPDGKAIPEYVIATAGTNPYSFFGWFVEDFQVVEQCPWPHGEYDDLHPMISEGTAKGLTIITEVMSDQGATVFDCLNQLTRSRTTPFTISVVGHSLGGALSSTLALEMVDRQAEWDPKQLATVQTSPSAGPTAGDQDFAEYYDRRLGARTNRIWNAVDIVPHAWEVRQLEQIPGIYKPNIPAPTLLQAAMQIIVKRTKSGHYTQIAGNGNKLPGKYSNQPYQDPTSQLAEGGDPEIFKFAMQAGFQHTTAYHQLMGVSELIDLSHQVLNRQPAQTMDANELEGLLKGLVEM